ncbi:MAG: Hsp20/alpha crystallin family protein [Candidatus Moraniibacteriota bacterium]|jgi:HSP20 family protein
MKKEKKSFLNRFSGGNNETEQPMMQEQQPMSMPVYAEEEETQMQVEQYPQEEQPMMQSGQDDWAQEEMTETDDSEGQLTIDVYQTDTEIVIKSTIAGVKPEDLDVSISNDMLTIKGDRKNEEVVDDNNFYYKECYWGSFSRSVVLPMDVLADKIDATLKNGILTIRLPKADVTKTKKIQVRGF